MDTTIVVASISASVSVVSVTLGYFFTKSAEREAEWRRQKLEHYRELMIALSGIVKEDSTADAQRRFAMACNVIGLVASQEAISNLYQYRKIIAGWDIKAPDEHDDVLRKLILAIRRDLKITPGDEAETFAYSLWASGVGPGIEKSKGAGSKKTLTA
jgi:hypothetical protein